MTEPGSGERDERVDVEEIINQLEELSRVNIESELVRANVLGRYSFKAIIDQLQETQQLANELLYADLRRLPNVGIEELDPKIGQLTARIRDIRKFEAAGTDAELAKRQREELVQKFQGGFQGLLDCWPIVVSLPQIERSGYECLERTTEGGAANSS